MIPSRSRAEAKRRHGGQLVQWDSHSKIGYVQLDAPVLEIDVAELWGHDLRKTMRLAEGEHLNFLIGIEPQAGDAPTLRCGDVMKSTKTPRSRSPRFRRAAKGGVAERHGMEDEAFPAFEVDEMAGSDDRGGGETAGGFLEFPESESGEVPIGSEVAKAPEDSMRLQREAEAEQLGHIARSREARERRVLVDWTARTGRVCDWNADATEGWIEPDQPIRHRSIGKSGRVWFGDGDMSSHFDPFHPDFDIERLACKFLLYETESELGAAFVTFLDREGAIPAPRKLPPLEVLAPESPSHGGSEQNGGENAEDGEEDIHTFENMLREEGLEAEEFEETDEELPPAEGVATAEGGVDGAVEGDDLPNDEAEETFPVEDEGDDVDVSGHDGDDGEEEMEPGCSAQQIAKAFLQHEVPDAMSAFEDLETVWSLSELNKRMNKYFIGGLTAAAAERSDWKTTGRRFVEKGLGSFSKACGSRKWFSQAEEVLKPLLSRAAWELVQDCEDVATSSMDSVTSLVDQVYEEMTEYHNFDSAVHDAVQRSFGEFGETVMQKMMTALGRTHQGAEKESAQTEGASLLRKIEVFTETWVNKSMDRAAVMIDSDLLQENTIVQLFRYLLHPETSSSYSCVPMQLRRLGRPPRGWKFLRPCVQDMLKRWAEANGEQCPRRMVRKRPLPQPLHTRRDRRSRSR